MYTQIPVISVHGLALSVGKFHPISTNLVQKPAVFQQAKGNTWLFAGSHTTSKWLLQMPCVDNLVLGFHLSGHAPSFLCPFTLSYTLYCLILFSCRIKHKRGDNTVLSQSCLPCCFCKLQFQRLRLCFSICANSTYKEALRILSFKDLIKYQFNFESRYA